METHLGLSPEEMLTIFNRMYLDVWEKTKEKIDWTQADVQKLMLEVFEVVVTAIRDGVMLTMFENNEKIYFDLEQAGFKFPSPELVTAEEEEETEKINVVDEETEEQVEAEV